MASTTNIQKVPTVGLAPGEHLPLSQDEAVITVSDGVVYVMLDDDEVVLTPGDRLVIPAGDFRRAWNAGDTGARLCVDERPPLLLAA
jgi:quercetin dioxygenase-like cupin family protein